MLIYMLITILLNIIEIKLQKSYLTPLTTFSVPSLLLIIFHKLIYKIYGFYPIENKSYYYMLVFNITVFCVSIISRILFTKLKQVPNKKNMKYQNYIDKTILLNEKVIVKIYIFSLLMQCISLVQTIKMFGIENIKGNAFGLFAHLGDISTVLSPYILYLIIFKKKKIYMPLLLITLINLIIFGGKYGIFFFLFHNVFFLFLFQKDTVFNMLKKIIMLVLIGLGVFIFVYGLIPLLLSEQLNFVNLTSKFNFIFKHMSYYILSPIIASGYFFNQPLGNPNGSIILLTVPVNILKAIFGSNDYLVPIISSKVPVSFEYNTNVGGLSSELIYAGGWGIGLLFLIILYIIIYYFYYKMIFSGKYLSLTSFLLVISVLSFFGNFYLLFGTIIKILILLFIEMFLELKGTGRIRWKN